MIAATGTGSACSRGTFAPGEHQQVGAVAAHSGGQVVEPEQAVQPFGILFVAFEPVDERQLLVDQRSAAPRQRLEHVARPAAAAGPARRPGSTACSCSSSTACATCPTSSVVCTGIGCDRARVHAGAHPLDLTGQVLVGHLEGAVAQWRSGRTSERATSVTISRASRIGRADDRRVADGGGALRRRPVLHGGGDRRTWCRR